MCKIPLARSHLRVKCNAGRVKVLTICVVLFKFKHLGEKMEHEGQVTYLEILQPELVCLSRPFAAAHMHVHKD